MEGLRTGGTAGTPRRPEPQMAGKLLLYWRLALYPKRFSATVLSVFAALLLQVSPVSGQTLKGTILGTVSDATHAVIPGVAVNIVEVNTNFRRTETSNDSGFFAFANLDPGAYRIEIEH